MIRRLLAALLLAAAAPAGGADLRDQRRDRRARRRLASRSPTAWSSIRDGRVVAAGNVRMKLPAGAQVIDATGKWVTPGHRRRLLAPWPCRSRSCRPRASDDTSANGPFSAAIDVVPAINPLDTTIAVNRADGVTRALVAPGDRQQHLRRAGRGHRHRRRHGPGHRAATLPVRRARRDRRGQGGRLARLGARPVPQCAARSGGAAPLRARRSRLARAAPDERERPVDPQSQRIAHLRPRRAPQRGRAADPLRRRRAGAGAPGPAISAGSRRACERHPPGARAEARIPVAEDRAGRRQRRLDRRRSHRARPGFR